MVKHGLLEDCVEMVLFIKCINLPCLGKIKRESTNFSVLFQMFTVCASDYTQLKEEAVWVYKQRHN